MKVIEQNFLGYNKNVSRHSVFLAIDFQLIFIGFHHMFSCYRKPRILSSKAFLKGLFTDWPPLCDGPFNRNVCIQGSFIRICVYVK